VPNAVVCARERKEAEGREEKTFYGIGWNRGVNTNDFCVQDEGTSCAYIAGL